MYSFRTIIILLIIGALLLGALLYLLLKVPQSDTSTRETVTRDAPVEEVLPPSNEPVSGEKDMVPQDALEPTNVDGTDAGMEFPIFEG